MEITFSPEVAEARAGGAPLVALESTIITHGMPWPRNFETARAVEDTVRAEGAVPATMAVMDGRLHAGLTGEALERLAQAKDVMKLSRADLAVAVATG
ncbi:MAG: pseudouridine-5'-phosphate glycosidase, partial [Pseudomonadota bacterium]